MGGQEENSRYRQGRPGMRLSTSTWGLCACSEWATFQEPTRKGESGQLNNSQWSCDFLKDFFFFNMEHFQSFYWICYNVVSALCFVSFGHEACGILVPWPGIELVSLALKGEVLTTGQPGKSQ